MELFTDGGSRGNPGEAGGGVFLITDKGVVKKSIYFGKKTNNEAEYLALIEGLKLAKQYGEKIKIYMDSQLIVRQIKGVYKVKNERLHPLYSSVMILLKHFSWEITHVLREKNKEADYLANLAMDQRASILFQE